MKLSKIYAIYKKEILDLLRDKKTIIMMILVPLLLYPLIMIAAMLITSSISETMKNSEYSIGIQTDADSRIDLAAFTDFLENSEDELEYHFKVVNCDDYLAALLDESIDAYIITGYNNGRDSFTVCYLTSITNSATASNLLEDKLELYAKNAEEALLRDYQLDPEAIMNPIILQWEDKSANEEKVGSILGAVLPFLLIISISMGAVYPAIDTTAGEKERGTLETLLTLPMRNDELIMGKFLAVATISVISALLNLLSMGFMGIYLYNMILTTDESSATINLAGFIPALLIVILCVLAFSLFISAMVMCITIFAKSFKEANNYVTPLLLVVMFAGYIGFIPNLKFDTLMASVPVVNISLLIHDLLLFKYNFGLIFVVLISNVAYAALSIWVLGRLYDSEELLFGEGGVNLQIFTRRSDLKRGGIPNFSDAILVTAVTMLLILYLGSLLQLKFLITGVLFTQLMIIAVPMFAAWYTKKDFRQTFSLQLPGFIQVIGAILLEIAVFLLVLLLSSVLTQIWPQDVETVNDTFEMLLSGLSFPPALLIIALAPAICEEALFRGYLLSAAKGKFRPLTAMLIVSVLFGIYHLSLVKLFTTALLGLAFCYVVHKSGSILLSSIMHFLNNGVSVIIMFYPTQMEKLLPILFQDKPSVQEIVLLIIIVLVCGICGIFLLERKKNRQMN